MEVASIVVGMHPASAGRAFAGLLTETAWCRRPKLALLPYLRTSACLAGAPAGAGKTTLLKRILENTQGMRVRLHGAQIGRELTVDGGGRADAVSGGLRLMLRAGRCCHQPQLGRRHPHQQHLYLLLAGHQLQAMGARVASASPTHHPASKRPRGRLRQTRAPQTSLLAQNDMSDTLSNNTRPAPPRPGGGHCERHG